MNTLSQSIETVNGVCVVELRGRFDAQEAPRVITLLQEALDAGQARVVVNLKAVHFVDSTGLSVLVRVMKQSRQRQGDVRICGLQQPVRIIFELTRMDHVFALFDTEEQAIAASW